jgi:hypothetical protein
MNIDSVLSVAVRDQCIYIGTTGLAGSYTEEFRAYETIDKVMSNEKLYSLLKNKNPKVRFIVINILHDRSKQKLFKKGSLLLKNDTSVVWCIWMFPNRTSTKCAYKVFSEAK